MTTPLLLHPFGHDVEESGCVIHLGRHVGFPPGSAHLGLCNEDFPDHHAKPCDTTMTTTILPMMGDFVRSLGTEQHPFGCSVSLKEIPFMDNHPSHSNQLRTRRNGKNNICIARNQHESFTFEPFQTMHEAPNQLIRIRSTNPIAE